MKKFSIAYYIIASVIIWAAVIIGCALKLKGTDCYQSIDSILIGGVIAHLLFIWGPLGRSIAKNRKKDRKE